MKKRIHIRGKFIYCGSEKLYIRGVTYGTFRPDDQIGEYHTPELVRDDFQMMVSNGINAVRTYTVPPLWLLDAAQEQGLLVMVGLPWEQHIAFLEDDETRDSIKTRIRTGVRECAGHPAVMCYTIGNEIPGPIVRWYGRKKVELFLKQLYQLVKAEDPGTLVTYVNYPTTEYLRLPFLDFSCFNVYLEKQEILEAYLARLHNLTGDRPLVMAEIGLDSRRNGEQKQAETLDWQVRSTFASGCAGAFVFSWTDEWHRGGYDIDDWDFGLTRRDRSPKPALAKVKRVFAEVPFPYKQNWPRISVIVCSYNGSKTMRDCCEGLAALHYPNYEVISVDDGSTDNVGDIAEEFGFSVIRTKNQGLSRARNTGLHAATGEIVAYIDDDARPDPHWLMYLAHTYETTDFAGVGGPNIPPQGDGLVAECVANAPGGPIHVLTSDRVAEHIPGCNMSFRRKYLESINGFDGQFRIAGDDVDACWRIQENCGQLGFHPAAMVWHHRRNSIKAYWKQQLNYGKAEALLERKWPQKYNSLGHCNWKGRLYNPGILKPLNWFRSRIYHGVWGSGLFQSIYEFKPGLLATLPLMPEWYVIIPILFILGMLGFLFPPLLIAWPFLLVAVAITLVQAYMSSSNAVYPTRPETKFEHVKYHYITWMLHLLQPLARLIGRIRYGLTPWRRNGSGSLKCAIPRPNKLAIYSEQWQPHENRLLLLERTLMNQGALVTRGGDFDRWDIAVRGGFFTTLRIRTVAEEHGGGKQFIRFYSWPWPKKRTVFLLLLNTLSFVIAFLNQYWWAAAVFGLCLFLMLWCMVRDCGAAVAFYLSSLKKLKDMCSPDKKKESESDAADQVKEFKKSDGKLIEVA